MKVKCKVCSSFEKSYCKIKKVKVKESKPRTCELFEQDFSKIKIRTPLKTTYVPYHMTSRKAYNAYVKEKEKEAILQEELDKKLEVLKSPDILSRFRSSAE